LARTSKTPGRTQLIIVFSLDPERRLIDLPGYGFAKVPNHVKKQWQALLDDYLNQRTSLKGLILLMDIRHPMKEFDATMLEWAHHRNMPVHILLTKADKLKRGPAQSTLLGLKRDLAEYKSLFSMQLFSALKKQGLPDLHRKLAEWLALGEAPNQPKED